MSENCAGTLSKSWFKSTETAQSFLKEEIAAIKWFWPHDKLFNRIKSDNDILYFLPIEIRKPTKEDLLIQYQIVFEYFLNTEMVFYKQIFHNGIENVNISTPLNFITQFKPQEK